MKSLGEVCSETDARLVIVSLAVMITVAATISQLFMKYQEVRIITANKNHRFS